MKPQHPPVSNSAQIKALRDHLARKPKDGRAWLSLAQLLSDKPSGHELRQAVGQSIKLLPDNHQVWVLAAKMQQREHGAAAVLNWLKTVAQQNPEVVAIKLASASVRSSRDPDGALSGYQQIIKSFPKDTRAYILLAGLLQKLARFDDAVKVATRAIELDRRLLAAWGIRAEAYRQSFRWQEALSDFQEIKKHRPQDPRPLNKIGVCLIRLDQHESAAEHFEKALELDPGYTIAKINIGLLCATQLKSDEAVVRINDALQDPALDAATRRTANITLAILMEQQRLRPFLEQAQRSGIMTPLQAALDETPAALLQADQQSVDKLWQLATLCRDFQFTPEDFSYSAGTEHLSFIEACAHCKVSGDAKMEMALKGNLNNDSARSQKSRQNQNVLIAWQIIRDRQNIKSDVLQRAEGEAWLRYWQARLLFESPEKLPGQYKAITNTIGHEMPTPPECVAGTYRLLLRDIRPTIPAGLARAVFMYVAVSLIHGFCDGNGRLARFLLAWETETTGLPAIVIPLELRAELATSLVKVLFEAKLEPLASVLSSAHASTHALLTQSSMDL